jgi:RHS repeat-associated protein
VEGDFYSPFGETSANPLSPFTGVKHKYTSQELDSETGLYNYNARLYNPEAGRLVSADSIVPDPSNPQSLNRYSYVLNNPVNMIDPTGYTEYYISPGGDGGSSSSRQLRDTLDHERTNRPRTISGSGSDSKVDVAKFFGGSSNSFGHVVQNIPVNSIDPGMQIMPWPNTKNPYSGQYYSYNFDLQKL